MHCITGMIPPSQPAVAAFPKAGFAVRCFSFDPRSSIHAREASQRDCFRTAKCFGVRNLAPEDADDRGASIHPIRIGCAGFAGLFGGPARGVIGTNRTQGIPMRCVAFSLDARDSPVSRTILLLFFFCTISRNSRQGST